MVVMKKVLSLIYKWIQETKKEIGGFGVKLVKYIFPRTNTKL